VPLRPGTKRHLVVPPDFGGLASLIRCR